MQPPKTRIYKPGENNIDAAVSIAVQSLLMADHWTGREDRVCSIKPEEMARRIKGMSEGLGLSVGSMPGLTYLLLLGMSLDTVKKCAQERAAIRGHERDMMGGGK